MSRNFISLILSVLFLTLLTAPSIVAMADDSIDISFFYDASDEEEKGSDKHKNIEVLVAKIDQNDTLFLTNTANNNLGYFFKKYPKPHLNLISPPPEFSI